MKDKKKVRVTLLVEDRTLERLAREVLLKFGFSRHEMYVIKYPVGRGSAKQWIDRQYPEQVKLYRSKANHQARIALLVGTDADQLTVQQRQNQLEAALQSAEFSSREVAERIALWIPRWHVETWLRALSGLEANEETDYKPVVRAPDFGLIAAEFVGQFRAVERDATLATLPSLLVTYAETRRIPDVK
jgi:hypothetical protein